MSGFSVGWPFSSDQGLIVPKVTDSRRRMEVWLWLLLATELGERALAPEFGLPLRWCWRGRHDCLDLLLSGLNERLAKIAEHCQMTQYSLSIPMEEVGIFPEPAPADMKDVLAWRQRLLQYATQRFKEDCLGLVYASPVGGTVPVLVQVVDGQQQICRVEIDIPVSRWCVP